MIGNLVIVCQEIDQKTFCKELVLNWCSKVFMQETSAQNWHFEAHSSLGSPLDVYGITGNDSWKIYDSYRTLLH